MTDHVAQVWGHLPDFEQYQWSYRPKTVKNTQNTDFTVVLALFTNNGFDSNMKNFVTDPMEQIWDHLEQYQWSYGPKTLENTENSILLQFRPLFRISNFNIIFKFDFYEK